MSQEKKIIMAQIIRGTQLCPWVKKKKSKQNKAKQTHCNKSIARKIIKHKGKRKYDQIFKSALAPTLCTTRVLAHLTKSTLPNKSLCFRN